MNATKYEAGLAELDACIAASSKPDVTGVTHVQPNNDAGSTVTADEFADVTGVTPEPKIPDEGQRPCFLVFDDWQALPDGGKLRPGAWYFSVKHGKGDAPAALIQQWICSPLHVEEKWPRNFEQRYKCKLWAKCLAEGGWARRSFHGQEISTAHTAHPHASIQSPGRPGCDARGQDDGRAVQAV